MSVLSPSCLLHHCRAGTALAYTLGTILFKSPRTSYTSLLYNDYQHIFKVHRQWPWKGGGDIITAMHTGIYFLSILNPADISCMATALLSLKWIKNGGDKNGAELNKPVDCISQMMWCLFAAFYYLGVNYFHYYNYFPSLFVYTIRINKVSSVHF